jgi:hypothetical protein
MITLGIDLVGEHVAVVAIAGDDAVLADLHRRLEADRDRFLADVEVAETADQPEAVKLPGALLEPAYEQHLAIEIEKLVLACLVALGLGRALRLGFGFLRSRFRFGGTRHGLVSWAVTEAPRL